MKINRMLLVTISSLCLALTACSDKSSSNNPSGSAISPAAEQVANDAMGSSGSAMSESTVTGHSAVAAASPTGGDSMTLEEIYAAYPILADRAAFLASIDRVVETDAGTFDMYSGGTLVMTLAHGSSAGTLTVVQSVNGFAADHISFMASGSSQDQSNVVESMLFEMSACSAVDQDQDQDKGQGQDQDTGKDQDQADKGQGQDQDKGQDTDKGQGQDQDKGQDTDKGQGQDQDQDKGTKVEEECQAIEVTLTLERVAQKDQDQDKGQDQDQDKGQDTDKGQGQDQDKGQDTDKGQGQDQDKGQDTDKGQGQDQDKGQDTDKGQGQDQDGKDQDQDGKDQDQADDKKP